MLVRTHRRGMLVGDAEDDPLLPVSGFCETQSCLLSMVEARRDLAKLDGFCL